MILIKVELVWVRLNAYYFHKNGHYPGSLIRVILKKLISYINNNSSDDYTIEQDLSHSEFFNKYSLLISKYSKISNALRVTSLAQIKFNFPRLFLNHGEFAHL